MDLKFYLSGGSANLLPDKSLGGDPSNQLVVSASLNNLFNKVKKVEINEGGTIYRCFYVVNNDTVLKNVELYLEQTPSLSTISLGVPIIDEIQQIIISGSPTGGSFILKYTRNVDGTTYEQNTDPIVFVADATTLSSNIQTALNNLVYLSEVVVNVVFTTNWLCTVNFSGEDGGRSQFVLEIASNNITGSDIGIEVVVNTSGYPINAVASSIGYENQEPYLITFSEPDEDTPIEIGTLETLDLFPIWVKRETVSDTVVNLETDNVKIKLVAN